MAANYNLNSQKRSYDRTLAVVTKKLDLNTCIKYQTTLYILICIYAYARHILPSAATFQASLPTVLSA